MGCCTNTGTEGIARGASNLLIQKLKPSLLFLLYGYVAWMALYPFLTYWHLDNPVGGFQSMIDGTAFKPFVYRRLIADLLRAFEAGASPALLSWLTSSCKPAKPWPTPFIPFGPVQGYVALYSVWVGISWSCFLGHAYLMRRLVARFYPGQTLWMNMVPVVTLGMLPLAFRYFSYIYDPATIFLSTLCLWLILERSWAFYCAAFLAACLNKETSILLIFEYLVIMWGVIPRSRVILGAGAQITVWAAVTLFIRLRYMNARVDPVTPNQFHLIEHNILYLAQNPLSLLYFVLVVGLFSLMIACNWRSSPLILRRCLMVTLPLLVVPCVFFGYLDELRAYYDAWPIVVLLALPGLADLIGSTSQEISR